MEKDLIARLIEAARNLSAHDHADNEREGLEPCFELEALDDVLAEFSFMVEGI